MSLILYVEDDALLQADGEMVLIAAGHEVLLAMDGQEACAVMHSCGRRLDALITDIQLPGGVNGWKVAEEARTFLKDLPVLYVTASESADFDRLGVSHSLMVPKPFAWAQVLSSLARLIGPREGNAVLSVL